MITSRPMGRDECEIEIRAKSLFPGRTERNEGLIMKAIAYYLKRL